MGLSIGQAPPLIGGPRAVRSIPSLSLRGSDSDRGIRLLGQRRETGPTLFGQSRNNESPNRGLEITSGPGAALNALSRTVDNVRDLFPSIQELQLRFQLSAREDRENRENALERSPFAQSREEPSRTFNRVESRIPNPSATARRFVNALNDTASSVGARLSGEPQESRGSASFQINGETFPFRGGSGGVLNLSV